MVLEKTLDSPLDCKEIQPIHSEGDQPWNFFGRNDAEAETPVLWPPHVKSWLIGKDSDAGRDWRQEEKGTTEDEMAGWHHWLDGHESEWTPGVGDGQGGLVCCDSWGRKESDMTEWLNWTELVSNKVSFFQDSFRVVCSYGLPSSLGKFSEPLIWSQRLRAVVCLSCRYTHFVTRELSGSHSFWLPLLSSNGMEPLPLLVSCRRAVVALICWTLCLM